MPYFRVHTRLYEYDSRDGQDIINVQVEDFTRNKQRAISMSRQDFEDDVALTTVLQQEGLLKLAKAEFHVGRDGMEVEITSGDDIVLHLHRIT